MRRLRREDGFTMPMAMMILLVGLLLATALIGQAIATHSSVRRDGASKRAVQAALAGANTAAWLLGTYSRTTESGNPDQQCISRVPGQAPEFQPLADDLWCPEVELETGAGTAVRYRVSAPYEYEDGKISRDIIAVGEVPANGTGEAVVRRVRQRITETGTPNVFDDWTVVSLETLELDSNAEIGTQQVRGNARSNGDIVLRSNATICGDAVPGPNRSVQTHSNARVCGSTAPAAEEIVLQDPVAPSGPNDNAAITAGCGGYTTTSCLSSSTWNATRRELSLTSNDRLTVIGNTYVLCSLKMSSNSWLTLKPRVATEPIRIYIDSAANCPGTTERTILLSSNTQLKADPSSPFPLQMYVTGQATPDVELSSNVEAHWMFYGPLSTVWLNSNVKVVGGIAAKKIHLDSNAEIHTRPAGTGSIEIGGPVVFDRDAFVECTATTDAANPGGGC